MRAHLNDCPSVATETDAQGMTPLHYGCASSIWRNHDNGEREFLRASGELLSAGASVAARDTYHGLAGITPLFYAAWTGGQRGIAQLLIQHGAAITPEIFLAALGHFQRHGEGNYEIAELLLAQGHDINHNDQRTALHACASHEDARAVSWLLQHGADFDAQDSAGDTPLMVAARRNTGVKVLRVLIEAGASVSRQNSQGQAARDLALLHGKAKAVAYLDTAGQ